MDGGLDFTEDGPRNGNDYFGFWICSFAEDMASDMGGYHHIVDWGYGVDDK